MENKTKPRFERVEQVKKLVDEVVTYVQADLFERNASRIIPALSRSNLFVKPKNWDSVFTHPESSRPFRFAKGGVRITSKVDRLDEVISRAQQSLLDRQDPDQGFWCAPLLADTTLESDTITLFAYMGWL